MNAKKHSTLFTISITLICFASSCKLQTENHQNLTKKINKLLFKKQKNKIEPVCRSKPIRPIYSRNFRKAITITNISIPAKDKKILKENALRETKTGTGTKTKTKTFDVKSVKSKQSNFIMKYKNLIIKYKNNPTLLERERLLLKLSIFEPSKP